MRSLHISLTAILLYYCSLCALQLISDSCCPGLPSQIKYPERECIVKLRDIKDSVSLHDIVTSFDTYVLSWYRYGNFYRIHVPESITLSDFCNELLSSQYVEYAQPDYFINGDSITVNFLYSNDSLSKSAAVRLHEMLDSKKLVHISSIAEGIFCAVKQGASMVRFNCSEADSPILRDALRFASSRGGRLICSCDGTFSPKNDSTFDLAGNSAVPICQCGHLQCKSPVPLDATVNDQSGFRHDVIVTDVKAPQWCIEGEQIQFIVTLKNQGMFEEKTLLTSHDSLNAHDLATVSCILKPGETKKNILVWDTGKSGLGTHPIVIGAKVTGDEAPEDNIKLKDVTVVNDRRDVAVVGAEIVKLADSGSTEIVVQLFNDGTYNEIVQVVIRGKDAFEAMESAVINAQSDLKVAIPCGIFYRSARNDSLQVEVQTTDQQEVNFRNNKIIIPIE